MPVTPVTEFKITDIPTTAVTPAADDYLELGGSTNGSRKVLFSDQARAAGQYLSVNSVAALKALTVSSAITFIEVLGYYTAGDGGGGIFRYDSGSAATANLGTIFAPDSGSGRWLRQYSGPINALWFGAKGDDTTNNSAVFTALVDFCKTDGKSLYFPKGTYVTDTNFPTRQNVLAAAVVAAEDYKGMEIFGDGRTSIIKTKQAAGADVFQLNGVANLTIRNLGVASDILGGSTSGSNAFSFTGAANDIEIREVHVYVMPYVNTSGLDGGSAFSIQHSTSNAFSNIVVRNCTTDGGTFGVAYIGSGVGAYNSNPASGIVFEGNELENFYRGVTVETNFPAGAVVPLYTQTFSVSGNRISNCQQSVYCVGSTGISFVGNTVLSTLVAAVDPATGAAWLAADTNLRGLYVGSCHHSNFDSNTFYLALVDHYAALVGGAEGALNTPCTNLNVVDNSFSGTSALAGVFLGTVGGYIEQCHIVANTITGASTQYDAILSNTGYGNVILSEETSIIPNIYGARLIAGGELVSNGTAWTGATGATPPTGWLSAVGGVYTIFDSGDGAPYDICLKLEVNGAGATPPTVYQNIVVKPYRAYKVSFAFKKGTAGTGTVFVGSTAATSDLYDFGNVADATWTTHSAIVRTTTSILSVSLRNNSATPGETCLFDTVSVTELPLALIGDVHTTGNLMAVIPTYANNAAALAGGLIAGQFYRVNAATDPEPLYIVH